MELTVAITGASGTVYARRTLQLLATSGVVETINLIVSDTAITVAQVETGVNLREPNVAKFNEWLGLENDSKLIRFWRLDNLAAKPSSGSNKQAGMIIVPCSMGTLGAIASGAVTNLIHRAADVSLKEGRKLVLVPREMPYNAIHLENMRNSLRFMVQSPKSRLNSSFVANVRLCGIFLVLAFAVGAQVPSPQSVLGFHPTDDRTIADWKQIADYFARLDKASDRVLVKEIGRTTMDRPMIVAFISSPSNVRNLDKYRQISAKLADPRTVRDSSEADDLVKNGKTIVSISCSIHSTEIVASQISMNLAYELATANDADTKEILDNTILLLIPSPNPDGVQIVADWYRKTFGSKAEGSSPPELYHYYAGHDDNRDWFMHSNEAGHHCVAREVESF